MQDGRTILWNLGTFCPCFWKSVKGNLMCNTVDKSTECPLWILWMTRRNRIKPSSFSPPAQRIARLFIEPINCQEALWAIFGMSNSLPGATHKWWQANQFSLREKNAGGKVEMFNSSGTFILEISFQNKLAVQNISSGWIRVTNVWNCKWHRQNAIKCNLPSYITSWPPGPKWLNRRTLVCRLLTWVAFLPRWSVPPSTIIIILNIFSDFIVSFPRYSCSLKAWIDLEILTWI